MYRSTYDFYFEDELRYFEVFVKYIKNGMLFIIFLSFFVSVYQEKHVLYPLYSFYVYE